MEKWLNSSPSQGDIHGFESRWGHHKVENTPVYWTKIWYDIRGFSLWKDTVRPRRISSKWMASDSGCSALIDK